MPNQTPEQISRDAIDAQLRASGWAVQNKEAIDFSQGEGQAVREYLTDSTHNIKPLPIRRSSVVLPNYRPDSYRPVSAARGFGSPPPGVFWCHAAVPTARARATTLATAKSPMARRSNRSRSSVA
jgi:hypothetical protein